MIETRVAPKFSDFCVGRYKQHAIKRLRPSTWGVRQYQIATLVEHFGDLRLTEITTPVIEHFTLARSVAPRSVNNELAALCAILSYARDNKILVVVTKIIMLPVKRGRDADAWSDDEVASLFHACSSTHPSLLRILVFIANTGCRRAEALAFERANIDRENRLLRFGPSIDWQPKDNEPREVPFDDHLLPWLDLGPKESRWLLPCPRTGARYACWPKRQFDELRSKAGLTGGPHKLRHTFASHFLKRVPDINLLARVMGHSDAEMTRTYAHRLPDHLARARGAVSFMPTIRAAEAEAQRRWKAKRGTRG